MSDKSTVFDSREPETVRELVDAVENLFLPINPENYPSAAAVSGILSQQESRYNSLYSVLTSVISELRSPFHELFAKIWDKITETYNFRSSFDAYVSSELVRFRFPILEDEKLKLFLRFCVDPRLKSASKATKLFFVSSVLAALIRNSADVISFRQDDVPFELSESIMHAMAVLRARETGAEASRSFSKEYERQKAQISQLDENFRKLLKSEKLIQESLFARKQESDIYKDQIASYVDDAQNTFAAIKEEHKLAGTQTLWTDRADNARKWFMASTGLLILCLVGFPILIWCYSDLIVQKITQFEQASIAVATVTDGAVDTVAYSAAFVSRLALVVLPIALIVWFLRIVVRFQQRSLALMDDAQQRTSILRTYLYMVEQDEATRGDRAAVLEALFRGVPGHGTHTAEPPDFIDLIKLGNKGTTG